MTVCCVKARPAYDHHYVNRLQAMVAHHMSLPHRFVCFTDDPSGIKCPTRALPSGLTGWWAELALHRPNVLSGPVLYLDLDTVILDSLDFIASYGGDFSILRDFYRPDGYGSGVMLWRTAQPQVWNRWIAEGRPDNHHGDQGWMEEAVPNADRLQDVFPGKFCSFKADECDDGAPVDAAVMCFHGYPKPHELPETHWAYRLWAGEKVGEWIS